MSDQNGAYIMSDTIKNIYFITIGILAIHSGIQAMNEAAMIGVFKFNPTMLQASLDNMPDIDSGCYQAETINDETWEYCK